jgi:hypothetical protein
MDLPPARHELTERFFQALLEATFPLKTGPDPELTLEALIEATQRLGEHLEHELQELREEQAD